jgi:hypothetical protein
LNIFSSICAFIGASLENLEDYKLAAEQAGALLAKKETSLGYGS